MSMAKFYIVWNEAKNEGFVTADKRDAMEAVRGRFRNPSSVIGEAFFNAYEDDYRTMQEIKIAVN